MNTYKIPLTDLEVSRIAYGCDRLGCEAGNDAAAHNRALMQALKEPVNLTRELTAKATRIINVAYDNGITLYDLADFYGGGASEAAFGEVLKKSPHLRDKIIIQSKCGARELGVDLSRDHIIRAAEGSLKRLVIERLDILLLHLPDALVEPQEVAQAFDRLQRSGKVRYFGVSNHTSGQIELLRKYVPQPLIVNQIQLSLGTAHPIIGFPFTETRYTGLPGIVDYCRLHSIQIQAFSPLKIGDYFSAPSLLNPPADASPEIRQAAQVLADISKQKGTTPAALSLAWLLRHPAGIVPIIGATKPEHIVENCAADHIELDRCDWYRLFTPAAAIRVDRRV